MGERLTVKEPNGNYFFDKKPNHIATEMLEKALNKLGKCEDLEEELGIGLDILLDVMKNGAVVCVDYEWRKFDVPPEFITIDFKEKGFYITDFLEDQPSEWFYSFDSYGKWWK